MLLINLVLIQEANMSDFADVKFDFDTNENDNTFIPEGDYLTEIKTCEKTVSQAGNSYLKLEVTVAGDKYKGWIARNNFNLWYTNSDQEKQEMVREIASKQFSKLLKALGLEKNPPANAGELVGLKVISTFGIEKSDNPEYPDRNNITGFKAVDHTEKPKVAQVSEETPSWVNEESKPAKPSL